MILPLQLDMQTRLIFFVWQMVILSISRNSFAGWCKGMHETVVNDLFVARVGLFLYNLPVYRVSMVTQSSKILNIQLNFLPKNYLETRAKFRVSVPRKNSKNVQPSPADPPRKQPKISKNVQPPLSVLFGNLKPLERGGCHYVFITPINWLKFKI